MKDELSKLRAQFDAKRQEALGLGYSDPDYRARAPKIKAYQILLDKGYSPKQAIKTFKEMQP